MYVNIFNIPFLKNKIMKWIMFFVYPSFGFFLLIFFKKFKFWATPEAIFDFSAGELIFAFIMCWLVGMASILVPIFHIRAIPSLILHRGFRSFIFAFSGLATLDFVLFFAVSFLLTGSPHWHNGHPYFYVYGYWSIGSWLDFIVTFMALSIPAYMIAKRSKEDPGHLNFAEDLGSFPNPKGLLAGFKWTSWQALNDKKPIFLDRIFFSDNIVEKLKEKGQYKKAIQKRSTLDVIDTTKTVVAIGGMGSGKTEFFNSLLVQNDKKQFWNRAIINDVKGDFVEKFYNPDRDILFNIFDQRGKTWDIWREIKQFPAIMESFFEGMVMSGSDKADFFTTSAKKTLSDIAFKIGFDPSIPDHEKWDQFLAGVESWKKEQGDSKSGADIGRTIDTVMDIIELMAYRAKDSGSFTISEYLSSNEVRLFLLNNPAYDEKLKPLFNGFANALLRIFLSRPDTKSDFTMFLFDEILTFNIKLLKNALVTLRSKGGCLFMGMQFIPKHDKEIQQLLDNSRHATLLFKISDQETLDHVQKMFGEVQYEKERTTTSVSQSQGGGRGIEAIGSLGSNTSYSYSKDDKKDQIVTNALLASLPDYHHLTYIAENKGIFYAGYTDLVPTKQLNTNFDPINFESYMAYKRSKTTQISTKDTSNAAAEVNDVKQLKNEISAILEKLDDENVIALALDGLRSKYNLSKDFNFLEFYKN